MAIGSLKENRVIRDGGVQVLPGGEDRRRPMGLDPSSTVDPLSGGNGFGLFGEPMLEFLEAGSAFEVEGDLAFTDGG